MAGEPGTLGSTRGGLWFGLCPNSDSSPRCLCAAFPSSSSSLAISSPPCGLCTRNSTVSGTGARKIEAGSSAHWSRRGFCTPCVVLGGGTPHPGLSVLSGFCGLCGPQRLCWRRSGPVSQPMASWGPVALIKEERQRWHKVVSWWFSVLPQHEFLGLLSWSLWYLN